MLIALHDEKYLSPSIEVLKINPHSLLCLSDPEPEGDIDDLNMNDPINIFGPEV